ncbi:PLD nuclease N-terminal domain-containing protein [Longispora sp. NPDC051575]|uniref:PLD nuclease N-terminal domain-containing protein n=1 Tax=Longispora sp. NPDC051575 TaxID=3154943 RepID=UPI003437CAA5
MARIYALLVVLDIILLVYATIDCITTPQDEVRNLPKVAWILLILLFSPIGWIAWFVAGRPSSGLTSRAAGSSHPAGTGLRPGGVAPGRPRQVAPDDDPEFLEGLAKQNRDDEKLLKDWEADLRRREEELRKKKDEPEES